MSKNTVERTVDLANFPPLTETERADLLALREMSDDDIDRSDFPQLTEVFSKQAVTSPFLRTTKIRATILLDSDVLAWFEAQGAEYQARINAVLRRAMVDAASRN